MLEGKFLIELRKFGFINKGSELMLLAALKELKRNRPAVKFVMATSKTDAPFEKRCGQGFYQKIKFFRMGFDFGRVFNLVPRVISRQLGVVRDSDIDVVIDGAGFSYSSQWGNGATRELALACKRWKSCGTKVILLPQAFGPFDNDKIKRDIEIVVNNSDLIFARDEISYNYLLSVVGEQPHIKKSVDFTNLVDGVLPVGRICELGNW